MRIRWIIFCLLVPCGCGANNQPDNRDSKAKNPSEFADRKPDRIPLEYEILPCSPNLLIPEPHFSVLFHNQRAEQTTASCSIMREGTPVASKAFVTVPGNGKLEFIGDSLGALKAGKLDGLIFPGDKVIVSSQFFNSEFEIQIPGKRSAAEPNKKPEQVKQDNKQAEAVQPAAPSSPGENPNKVAN